MADQGRWFKLWTSAIHDPTLGDLSLDDFARWCLFGCYLKVHGSKGSIEVSDPCRPLQTLFRVEGFEAVLSVVKSFPNCTVTECEKRHGKNTVTVLLSMSKWQYYQEDTTAKQRQKRARMSRSKKRREEKRREESNKPPHTPPSGGRLSGVPKSKQKPTPEPQKTYPDDFLAFWSAYPRKLGKQTALAAWRKIKPSPPLESILEALEWQTKTDQWTKEDGQFIPLPTTYLNQSRWEDEPTVRQKPTPLRPQHSEVLCAQCGKKTIPLTKYGDSPGKSRLCTLCTDNAISSGKAQP